ncbi:MAG: protein kinase [Ardenticatenaceae bacterium]|nr:protein kinase [Ardenticatenaceae bacterium]
MSTVYLAHDPHFERDVAIKLLPLELLHHSTFRRRFDREAKIVASLDHPAIVPVYDFGEQDDQPFLVMRFMAGGSLTDRLKQGPINIQEAVRILQHLAPALDEVHRRGIVHRDLKPSNILFDQRNEPFISDFGTAKFTYEHTKLTETGGAVGTPAYMSPEQIQAEVEIDGRSDIYTLGVILFEMLTGQHPYQTNTPIGLAVKHIFEPVPRLQDMQPSVPAACQPVIAKVMAKQRESRYQTAVAFADDLTNVACHLDIDLQNQSAGLTLPSLTTGRRLALLIGNSTYEDEILSQLIRPVANLPRLAQALKNPRIGRFDEVICLIDEPSNDVRRSISRFFAEKSSDDLLLLYFAGHAAVDASGHLHLATTDTEHDLLRGTAVSALFIADEMDNCPAQQQILVLDCYYSRALLAAPKTPPVLPGIIGKAIDTGASFSRRGQERVVLTASDATDYIWQESGVSGQPSPSRFTEFFIQGLEQGVSHGRTADQVTIGELYDFVTNQLAAGTSHRAQLPRKWLNEEQSKIVIAHNPQVSLAAATSPERPLTTMSLYMRSKIAAHSGFVGLANGRRRLFWLAAVCLFCLVIYVGGSAGHNGRVVFSKNESLAAAATLTPTATLPPTATHRSLSPTPTSTFAPTSTATPTILASATAAVTDAVTAVATTPALSATTLLPSSLFAAPDAEAAELAISDVGDVLTVLGRSEQGNWLYVLDGDYNSGYIFGDRVAWSGNFDALPVVPASRPASSSTAEACSPGACPKLTLDLYPLDGRCAAGIRYRTIYMQGQGGDGRYTYYWNGTKVAGPLTTGFGFEINNRTGPRVTGTGKVVSGDGQSAEKPLVISEFPCNP